MCVRSSITFYGNFNLDMDRSPGFGSTNTNYSPSSDLVSLRLRTSLVLNLANISNSPDRSTKSTQSEIASLLLFVSTRFQVFFHSPPGVLFTFPSQYFSTVGHRLVFRLGGWSPGFPQGFSCPVVLWILLADFRFRLHDFHVLWSAFPKQFSYLPSIRHAVRNPR